jgi:hypothetical protein
MGQWTIRYQLLEQPVQQDVTMEVKQQQHPQTPAAAASTDTNGTGSIIQFL